MSNTIKIKDYLKVFEEYKAHAAITPGHLIVLNSDNEVAVHTSADGAVLPMFAIEDELQGNDIATAYSTGDKVQVWIATRGDIVNAILLDGETVVIGDFLVSAGNGELKKLDTTTSLADIEYPVGIALAVLDLSSSSTTLTSVARIPVRIM